MIEQYINKYILDNSIIENYNIQKITEGSENELFPANHGDLNTLIKKIYKNVDENGNPDSGMPVYTSWLSGNKNKDSYITQRVNCDVYGGYGKRGYTIFNTIYPGVGSNETHVSGGHEAVCDKDGLLKKYKGETFTKYVAIIDQNSYIEGSDLLKYGTLRYAKKREIIYVKN